MTATKADSGGSGKLSSPSVEYACARRLRHRLLLSYLYQQGLHPAFQSMIQQTEAHLSAEHLRDLVARGQWDEATDYLDRFNLLRSLESQALFLFLHTLRALDVVAAGANGGAIPSASYHHGITVSAFISSCPELCYLVKDMLSLPRQCASMDWKLVCSNASLIAYDLAHESPDLTRLTQLPAGAQVLPHNVLPICPRPRRHVRRPAGRPPGPTIAKLYLNKRTSLASSNPCSGARFMDESLDWAARYLGICLRAGRRQELQQRLPLQSFGKQAPASIAFGDMMPMKMDSGSSGKLSRPVEYDCARRLRHRLVLSYLSQQGLHPTYQSMVQQTDAHLCVKHLQQLVARGLWSEAVCYVCRFLPSDGTCKGIEDRPLLLFLYALWTFANIAASASHAAVAPDLHRNDLALCLSVCRNTKLRTIVVRLLKLPQFRASLNWGVISNKASFIACDLARESPELSHRVVLPSDPATLHDVLPICPRRRRYVKEPPGRSPAHTITKLYLNKRRSLPYSNPQPGFATTSLNQVAELIMKCFNIGESLEFLQSSKKEDAPGAPFSQTMFNTLTDPAKTIGTSSVKNAGAPVSLPAKTSGILSGTYAGTTDTIQDIVLRKNPRTELSTVGEDPDPKRQRTCIKLASVHRPEAEVHKMNLMA